jgi:hypothetical protein
MIGAPAESPARRWTIAVCLVVSASLVLAIDTYRSGIEAGDWFPFAASIAACLVAGFLIRSPWALLLAAVPPLVAAPLWLAPNAMGFLTWLVLLYLASPAYLLLLGLGALAGAGYWKSAGLVTAGAAVAIGVLVITDEEPDDQVGADELAHEVERIDSARHGSAQTPHCIRFSAGADEPVPFRCDVFTSDTVRRYEVRVERESGRFHVEAPGDKPPKQGCCIEVD